MKRLLLAGSALAGVAITSPALAQSQCGPGAPFECHTQPQIFFQPVNMSPGMPIPGASAVRQMLPQGEVDYYVTPGSGLFGPTCGTTRATGCNSTQEAVVNVINAATQSYAGSLGAGPTHIVVNVACGTTDNNRIHYAPQTQLGFNGGAALGVQTDTRQADGVSPCSSNATIAGDDNGGTSEVIVLGYAARLQLTNINIGGTARATSVACVDVSLEADLQVRTGTKFLGCNQSWMRVATGGRITMSGAIHIQGSYVNGWALQDSGSNILCNGCSITADAATSFSGFIINLAQGSSITLDGMGAWTNAGSVTGNQINNAGGNISMVGATLPGSNVTANAYFPVAAQLCGWSTNQTPNFLVQCYLSSVLTNILDFEPGSFALNFGSATQASGVNLRLLSDAAHPQNIGFFSGSTQQWQLSNGATTHDFTLFNSPLSVAAQFWRVADNAVGFQNAVQVGTPNNGVSLALSQGDIGIQKSAASANAPGATGAVLRLVCGTGGGTLKLVAFGGTSNTPATILDNIGGGATGC